MSRLDHRCARQAATMAAIPLSRVLAILLIFTGRVRSVCLVKPFNITSQNLQYSATLSQILPPCTPAGINISRLYLNGDCIDDACTARADDAACPQVFSAANDNNYRNPPAQDESNLSFDSNTLCGTLVPNTSYFYVNTTCTNFNIDWIVLDPNLDPLGCHIYRAYNYGAAIGVIVAVVLFLALLISGWIFWYRRRSRQAASRELQTKHAAVLQRVYEPHHDIHMQPFPEGAAGQTYSSSLPAQQTASTDRLHPGFPAAGVAPGTVVQGTPVYPPWTGGGFKPPMGSTPR